MSDSGSRFVTNKAEHLQEFVKVFVTDEVKRSDQVEIWCHHLKQHGGESLVRELRSLEVTLCSAAVHRW